MMENSLNNTVIKYWVADNCTWKQQAVLLSALRGCDGRPKNDPSNVFKKKMRSVLLKNADTSTNFIDDADFSLTDEAREEINNFFTGCLDSYPMHYFLHFLHAAEIVGYKHPNKAIAEYWNFFYRKGVDAMHMNIETKEQLDIRLADKNE